MSQTANQIQVVDLGIIRSYGQISNTTIYMDDSKTLPVVDTSN